MAAQRRSKLSMRSRSGAMGLTAEKLDGGFPIRPYQRYVWGKAPPVDVIPFGGVIETDRFRFTSVHTTGHSKDHTVFLENLCGNVGELAEKGHSEKAVIKARNPRNDRGIKLITMGNVSFTNMVRSAMASIRNH